MKFILSLSLAFGMNVLSQAAEAPKENGEAPRGAQVASHILCERQQRALGELTDFVNSDHFLPADLRNMVFDYEKLEFTFYSDGKTTKEVLDDVRRQRPLFDKHAPWINSCTLSAGNLTIPGHRDDPEQVLELFRALPATRLTFLNPNNKTVQTKDGFTQRYSMFWQCSPLLADHKIMLTSLDLSFNSSSKEEHRGIGGCNFPFLERLTLRGQAMMHPWFDFDFSQLPLLKHLDMSFSDFWFNGELDEERIHEEVPFSAAELHSPQYLSTLDVSYCKMVSLECIRHPVFHILFPALRRLILTGNPLIDEELSKTRAYLKEANIPLELIFDQKKS
jgi:hypothetical protein